MTHLCALGAYASAILEEQFGNATELIYASLGWGDAEAAQLAEVLASGAASRLEELCLFENKIGDEGCKALAAALLGKEGAAPRLETLILTDNQIGDEGCKALAAALKDGAAPRLEALELSSNEIGDEGCKALAAALGKEGAAPQLETLNLSSNEIGNEGCKALAAALKEGGAPSLKARDAPSTRHAPPMRPYSVLPLRVQELITDKRKPRHLKVTCKERGIKLCKYSALMQKKFRDKFDYDSPSYHG
ncbi:hypothetical protein EMIHUDRAFT_244350 [Emiliania huxleyi CCMP1516]|uniref:Uncharacterized protein n=2 Tax=Emiliania huxleyi TaxID=2903 RepID=A0A0D3J0W8_EMIH1|nr:hypothetical protein EMIHUDRAFT_244350 [Emiliania huxleyi CCMP1516]EOD17153.1 hypothetical protein EMIHUDRAFT_244350 [Emiliania huxleyi CCMP1516]|eukprot:XP_005769582.1 hypothetical protein EMIHUDRAFT_244350 [Emiliania huxleyi CCMP1516]